MFGPRSLVKATRQNSMAERECQDDFILPCQGEVPEGRRGGLNESPLTPPWQGENFLKTKHHLISRWCPLT